MRAMLSQSKYLCGAGDCHLCTYSLSPFGLRHVAGEHETSEGDVGRFDTDEGAVEEGDLHNEASNVLCLLGFHGLHRSGRTGYP